MNNTNNISNSLATASNNYKSLTRSEAIIKMKEGEKITHIYFPKGDWVTMRNENIVTSDGFTISTDEFWSYRQLEGWCAGYSIYK